MHAFPMHTSAGTITMEVLWAVIVLGQFSDSGDEKGPCDNFKGFFSGKKWPVVTAL
jgi:hypothetical protein